jgi:hypothetical protein
MQWAMANGQSPNAPPVMVGRAVPGPPRLPTGRFRRFQADACNHGARPQLRILVAAWRAEEFVPVNYCATLAARCGKHAPPTCILHFSN